MYGRCSPGRWSAAFGVRLSQLQITFSILIVFQTFLSPVQGYLIDRFGPRVLLSIGGATDRIELDPCLPGRAT
jgi:MFS family permease